MIIENTMYSYGIILVKLDDIDTNKIKQKIDDLKDLNYEELKYKNNIKFMNNINKFVEYISKIKFLMIKKKHSYEFRNIIKCEFNPKNIKSIYDLLDHITLEEFNQLKNYSYQKLCFNCGYKYKPDNLNRFNVIQTILNSYKRIQTDTKFYYEFPKGKQNKNETEKETSIREVQEETGYKLSNYTLFDNLILDEKLLGTDHKFYEWFYNFGIIDEIIKDKYEKNYEVSEVNLVDYFNIYNSYEDPNNYNMTYSKRHIIIDLLQFIINYFYLD